MRFIAAPLIIGIITLGIYKLFELYARRRERLALIEKLTEISSSSLEKINLPSYSTRFPFDALKGGCLLIGIGLGLLIGFFICIQSIPAYSANFYKLEYGDLAGIIYGSCVLIFGGIGLITAFIIEIKMGKKDKE